MDKFTASGVTALKIGKTPNLLDTVPCQIEYWVGVATGAAGIIADFNGYEPPLWSYYNSATNGSRWQHTSAGITSANWTQINDAKVINSKTGSIGSPQIGDKIPIWLTSAAGNILKVQGKVYPANATVTGAITGLTNSATFTNAGAVVATLIGDASFTAGQWLEFVVSGVSTVVPPTLVGVDVQLAVK